jgi:hypothetical protein
MRCLCLGRRGSSRTRFGICGSFRRNPGSSRSRRGRTRSPSRIARSACSCAESRPCRTSLRGTKTCQTGGGLLALQADVRINAMPDREQGALTIPGSLVVSSAMDGQSGLSACPLRSISHRKFPKMEMRCWIVFAPSVVGPMMLSPRGSSRRRTHPSVCGQRQGHHTMLSERMGRLSKYVWFV